jgi:hypothetical protein
LLRLKRVGLDLGLLLNDQNGFWKKLLDAATTVDCRQVMNPRGGLVDVTTTMVIIDLLCETFRDWGCAKIMSMRRIRNLVYAHTRRRQFKQS